VVALAIIILPEGITVLCFTETSPLASTTIARRDPTDHDVQIEILFCGICHSDLYSVRNDWSKFMPTVTRSFPVMKLSDVSPKSVRQ